MTVINPLKKKRAKRTSVFCALCSDARVGERKKLFDNFFAPNMYTRLKMHSLFFNSVTNYALAV